MNKTCLNRILKPARNPFLSNGFEHISLPFVKTLNCILKVGLCWSGIAGRVIEGQTRAKDGCARLFFYGVMHGYA